MPSSIGTRPDSFAIPKREPSTRMLYPSRLMTHLVILKNLSLIGILFSIPLKYFIIMPGFKFIFVFHLQVLLPFIVGKYVPVYE